LKVRHFSGKEKAVEDLNEAPNPIALLTSNLIGHESNISLISLHLFDTSRDTSCLRRYWWFEDVDEEHFVVCEKEVLGEELAHKAARSGDCNLHVDRNVRGQIDDEALRSGNRDLFLVLVVDVDDLLHLVVRAHEDTRLVVDRLGNDLDHAIHLAVDCLAAGCGHVLACASWRLLVGRVGEDTTVQKSSVGIGNHATNVSRTVRLAALLLGHLHRVAPLLDGLLPPQRVTLVNRVDSTLGRHLHVGVGQNEFTEGAIHGETVDWAILHCHDELCRGTVHGEASSNHVGTGTEEVLLGALGTWGELVNTKDGSD
ncbi:fructose-1,6-bisphosphatase, partial [Aureobasidium melanogenum]